MIQLGLRLLFGIPKIVPSIPGYEVLTDSRYYVVAIGGDGKTYLIGENETEWLFYPRMEGFSDGRIDDRNPIKFQKL
jgi:hypothetical protein